MDTLIEWLVSAFVMIGGVFALVGSIGLARLPDFYTRLHGPTKATTLGVGGAIVLTSRSFHPLEIPVHGRLRQHMGRYRRGNKQEQGDQYLMELQPALLP